MCVHRRAIPVWKYCHTSIALDPMNLTHIIIYLPAHSSQSKYFTSEVEVKLLSSAGLLKTGRDVACRTCERG